MATATKQRAVIQHEKGLAVTVEQVHYFDREKGEKVPLYNLEKVNAKYGALPIYVAEAREKLGYDASTVKVVLDKWGRKDSSTNFYIETPEMVFFRVASLQAQGMVDQHKQLDFDTTRKLMFEKMVNKELFPNTPYMANAGHRIVAPLYRKTIEPMNLEEKLKERLLQELTLEEKQREQLFACFVLGIKDSRASIVKTLGEAMEIQAQTGGTGFNFRLLRPANEPVAGTGGASDGPVSYMGGFSHWLGKITNQGGKREGANMFMLDADHPDILRFIYSKQKDGEVPAANISIAAGHAFFKAARASTEEEQLYPLVNPHFDPKERPNLPKYYSKEQMEKGINLHKHNKKTGLSLRLAEDGETLLSPWLLEGMPEEERTVGKIKDGTVYLNARKVLKHLSYCGWFNGEPGIIFIDHINDANPTHPKFYWQALKEKAKKTGEKVPSLETIMEMARKEEGLPPGVGLIFATNPCITGDSRIPTDKGMLRMDELVSRSQHEEISIGVDCRSGSHGLVQLGVMKKKLGNAFMSGVKEIFKVMTQDGFELKATHDHKILTENGWKEVRELSPFDTVLIQSGEGLFNEDSTLPCSFRGITQWSRELGQILGFLIGDGWIIDAGKNRRVGFTFGGHEKKTIFRHLKRGLNRMYGKNIREITHTNGVIQLSFHGKEFVQFFTALGVEKRKAEDKQVPTSIWSAPREAVIGFLQGLFSADGTVGVDHIKGNYYIRLTSKSNQLLKGVQLLLLNLGIRSRMYERHREKRITFRYQTVRGELRLYETDGVLFELHISKDAVPLFLNQVGFMEGKNSGKIASMHGVRFRGTNFFDRVVGVEPAGVEPVFDLVEPETHAFVANGIVIHNCGEKPLLPYEACVLGHINLEKLVTKDSKGNYSIDWKKTEENTRLMYEILDNAIDQNQFTLKEIETTQKSNRKIGLGFMGEANMLFKLEIPYNSEEARSLVSKLWGHMAKVSDDASHEKANAFGVFPNFEYSMFRKGRKMRNAIRRTLAPTGTTGFAAQTTGGCEPEYALLYTRTTVQGTQVRVLNQVLLEKLEKYPLFHTEDERESFLEFLGDPKRGNGSLQAYTITRGPGENEESFAKRQANLEKLKKIFVTTYDISPEDHLLMQKVVQDFTDDAISKTTNFRSNAKPEDIFNAWLRADELKLKGGTFYRDGTRKGQPLQVKGTERKDGKLETAVDASSNGQLNGYATPIDLPPIMPCVRIRQKTPFGNMHVKISVDPKADREYEIFAQLGKGGDLVNADLEAMCRVASSFLRVNGRLDDVISQFQGIGSSMSIATRDGTINSLPSGVAVALARYQLAKKQHGIRAILAGDVPDSTLNGEHDEDGSTAAKIPRKVSIEFVERALKAAGHIEEYKVKCPECGGRLKYDQSCMICMGGCGYSKCG